MITTPEILLRAYAVSTETKEIPDHIKKLLRKYSSLSAPAKQNDTEALKALIEYERSQARLKESDLSQILALFAPQLKPETAQVLLAAGATIADEFRVEGRDAVFRALHGKNEALLLDLIERKQITVDHADADGTTLLMDVLAAEQFGLADKLFAMGANINATKTYVIGGGDSALHVVARRGSFQGVLWLLEHGADASIENSSRKLASEVLPELDEESKKEWDMDALFDALEDYRAAQEKQIAFEIPQVIRHMAYLESTPESQTEMQKRMIGKMAEEAAQKAQEADDLGVLPAKKKQGFF